MFNEIVLMLDLFDFEVYFLSVFQLMFKWGEFVLCEDILFIFNLGDVFFLIGCNGFGKMMFLCMLVGFLLQVGGEIVLGEGGDLAELIVWLGYIDGFKFNEIFCKFLCFWVGLVG